MSANDNADFRICPCGGEVYSVKQDDGMEEIGQDCPVSIEVQMYQVWAQCDKCGVSTEKKRVSMFGAEICREASIREWFRLHRQNLVQAGNP